MTKKIKCYKCREMFEDINYKPKYKGAVRLYCDKCVNTIIEIKELSRETNEKFIERVENMLYSLCGCDLKRGKIILEECLKRNEKRL